MRATGEDVFQAFAYFGVSRADVWLGGEWDPYRDVVHIYPRGRGRRMRRILRRWRQRARP